MGSLKQASMLSQHLLVGEVHSDLSAAAVAAAAAGDNIAKKKPTPLRERHEVPGHRCQGRSQGGQKLQYSRQRCWSPGFIPAR